MSYLWREYSDYHFDYMEQKHLLVAEMFAAGYLIQAIQVRLT